MVRFLESLQDEAERFERGGFPEDKKAARKLRLLISERLQAISQLVLASPAIEALVRRFGLNLAQERIVDFFYLYASFGALETYVDKLQEWEALDRIARWSGLGSDAAMLEIGASGKLVRSGLAVTDGRALRLPSRGITFGLAPAVFSFIDSNAAQPLSSYIVRPEAVDPLPLAAFELPASTLEAARATLRLDKGFSKILLFGKPGAGKTEFSRSLCVSEGLSPCFLKHDDSGKRSFADLILAGRLVDPDKEVLIVDEADEILNLDPSPFVLSHDGIKKSMVNDFFDSSNARMIFISNASDRIPDSILRRFAFHLEFEDFGPARRLKVWNDLCTEQGPFSADERRILASRYKANPSRIKQIIEICNSLESETDPKATAFTVAKDMLARSEELMYGIPREEVTIDKSYDLGFLNIDTPVERLLHGLEAWEGDMRERGRGVNLLFYGAPGTGKTAFGRHLAERLGLHSIVKRASDFLNPFVGMTERAIREAFKEAEGAVLIIDEADSLLADRQAATHGWERTMTNEMLTAMESFGGLFIASTNLRSVLDGASFRRFAFKVEFRGTEPRQRLALMERYFPDLAWGPEDQVALEAIGSLTLGDVAAVARKLELDDEVTPASILGELRNESVYHEGKAGRIGFLVSGPDGKRT